MSFPRSPQCNRGISFNLWDVKSSCSSRDHLALASSRARPKSLHTRLVPPVNNHNPSKSGLVQVHALGIYQHFSAVSLRSEARIDRLTFQNLTRGKGAGTAFSSFKFFSFEEWRVEARGRFSLVLRPRSFWGKKKEKSHSVGNVLIARPRWQ
jgi:hypothetical protein